MKRKKYALLSATMLINTGAMPRHSLTGRVEVAFLITEGTCHR